MTDVRRVGCPSPGTTGGAGLYFFFQAEKLADRGGLVTLPFAEQLRYRRRQIEGVSMPESPISCCRIPQPRMPALLGSYPV